MFSYPIVIENITTPLDMDYFWVFDLERRDFVLTKLEVLEEHTTPLLVMNIFGYSFNIPADWHILVYSEETSQIDIAEASEVCRGNFTAFVLNNKNDRHLAGHIKVLEYIPRGVIHTPALNKTQMLCHHIGPDMWVCISPTDNYNKYLKDATIGDILH